MTSCRTPLCRTATRGIAAALIVWVAIVSAGFWGLWSYASSPGPLDRPPLSWPAESQVPRTPGRSALIMFIHPRCPCTQASLAELERLQARLAGQVDLRIVALRPAGEAANWSDTPLMRRASLLPGTQIVADAGGGESLRFHAKTSGESLLYDPAGRLAYHGGITAARGHEGDNPGSDAILAFLAGRTAPASCPAFGCPLFRSEPPIREAAR